MTPKEAFIGKKPDVIHFRIFGSSAYYHIPSDTHTKLDQTAKRGYFVGYSETSKAYRIFIPEIEELVSNMMLSSWWKIHLEGLEIS